MNKQFLKVRHLVKLFLYKVGFGDFCRNLIETIELIPKRKRLQKYGYNILNEIDNLFSYNNIEYFAEFGTLLGIVREKQLLLHDTDIDFDEGGEF